MKLLLVEDDDKIASTVKRGLEAEGFSVSIASNGHDGIWLASEAAFDLIVLDIMLPGRNGYEICRDLRDRGNWTPILMLTAKDGDLDEAEALELGADDYLTQAVLLPRAGGAHPSAAPSHGPQPGAGQRGRSPHGSLGAAACGAASEEIPVTAREFEVLEFLVRRAGQVLSKQQILAGVWDYDFDGDPNIVEVYIRRLRRKVDEPYGRHAIETVRGAGYRVAEDGG